MQLEMRVRNADLVDALRNYAKRRLQFALDRFSDRISRLTIRVADLNGPRGGTDKYCHVQVEFVRSGSLVLEETDADLYAAIDRAAHRLGQALGRRLGRDQQAARQFRNNQLTGRRNS